MAGSMTMRFGVVMVSQMIVIWLNLSSLASRNVNLVSFRANIDILGLGFRLRPASGSCLRADRRIRSDFLFCANSPVNWIQVLWGFFQTACHATDEYFVHRAAQQSRSRHEQLHSFSRRQSRDSE